MIARNEVCWPGPAPDGVDPRTVPTRTLYTGAKIPAIGLGTFGSDRFSGEQIAAAVLEAASVGYRHFDCASVYGNEHLIGHSFARSSRAESGARTSGSPRSSGMTSTARPTSFPRARSRSRTCSSTTSTSTSSTGRSRTTIRRAATSRSRSPDAKPYIHENFMKTWRQMETLVDRGLVRHIGTSNMTIPKLKLVLRDARIKPACNEMELHPHFQQPELFRYVVDQGIVPDRLLPDRLARTGRSATAPRRHRRHRGPGHRPDRRAAGRPSRRSSASSGRSSAGRCRSRSRSSGRSYLANLKAVVGEPLTDEDMRDIAAIDRNCRLIKGQVFLWKDGQTWEDLWDVERRDHPSLKP